MANERAVARRRALVIRKQALDQTNTMYSEIVQSTKRSYDLLREECLQCVQEAFARQSGKGSAKPSGVAIGETMAAKGGPLRHALGAVHADRATIIAIVSQHWLALQHAVEALRNDREVVMAALRNCWIPPR